MEPNLVIESGAYLIYQVYDSGVNCQSVEVTNVSIVTSKIFEETRTTVNDFQSVPITKPYTKDTTIVTPKPIQTVENMTKLTPSVVSQDVITPAPIV